MDEMTRLRELRTDAPVPDRADLAPGRRRLTDAIEGRSRRTFRLRADWRIASLGAVVAITAAALFVTQIVDTSDPRQSGPATVAGDLDLSGPAAALGQAADFLERQEVPPEPRADQWVYLRQGSPEQEKYWKELPAEIRDRTRWSYRPDSWVPYDDKAAENDTSDTDYRTARESYRIAAGLPEDPEALLAELRKVFPSGTGPESVPETEDAHSFRALTTLLESYPLPPDALARMYRAMATIKGVGVTDHLVRDAFGRQVVAVTRAHDQNTQREILLDPVDYSYAGRREVVIRTYVVYGPDDSDGPDRTVLRPGDILSDIARTRAAVVDAKGQKP
ncbi:CU044_5270 family protein [Streptomyces rubiginosohelvolus]|uniref:CU044_5270 family protein n=1 Tax=Streptomyces rubiginosohelvolus TaxID=67362 RepID=UPI0035E20AEB